jgi:hypothetical protein
MEISFNEIDFDELILNIFNKEPEQPNSILINFDTTDIKELFDRLLLIFNNGCKLLFSYNGLNVNIFKLTDNDFILLNKYFNSFGINIYFKKFSVVQVSKFKSFLEGTITKFDTNLFNDFSEIELLDLINFKNSNSNYLEDLRFQLRVNDIVFILYFSFLTK